MTGPMEALYLYAQEHLFRFFLEQVEGYHVYLHREDQYTERLRALLDESGKKLLEDLSRAKLNILTAESEAAFQAGFRCAFELFR